MNILVTGVNGFIGRAVTKQLLNVAYSVRGTIRSPDLFHTLQQGVEPIAVATLGPETVWHQSLKEVNTVIHLAARVHVMNDAAADPLTAFRLVNVEGTRRLALEAARVGIRRFVFISSIKVNGEESAVTYAEQSPEQPTDPYGISKWEAEQALRRVEAETGLEVVVVRPTLVYGPGVKANFLNMMKIISRGIPLPLASIKNKRSLIYVGNLVDALVTCATHPKAAGQTFLVSDGEDVSTPELIRQTAAALGVPARLLPFPVSVMKLAGRLTGRKGAVNRLTGSLTVDSSKIRRELSWVPPFTMEQGLKETAEWFKDSFSHGRTRTET